MSEIMQSQNEFVSKNVVEDYYKSKMTLFDELEVTLIMESLKDLGKLKSDRKLGTVIDMGCGYGVTTSLMAKYFEKAIGIDSSQKQVEKAREISHPHNVEFKVGNAESLPIADDSIDVVIAIFAAQYFEIPPFLKECRRVLKPQGVVIIYSDVLSKFRSLESNLPPIVDEVKEMKDDCYVAAQALSHPSRHVLDNSSALYDAIVWEGKSKSHRTGEVVCSFAEVRDYYLKGVPFYAPGTPGGRPTVKLFEKIKNIWGIKDGDESTTQVGSSFLASIIILN